MGGERVYVVIDGIGRVDILRCIFQRNRQTITITFFSLPCQSLSLHEKGLILLDQETLLIGQIGPRLRSPKLQIPRKPITPSQIGPAGPAEVTLVDQVQIAATAHLRTLGPAEACLQPAIGLWF